MVNKVDDDKKGLVLSFDLILPFNEWMMMFNFIYFQKGI